MDTAIQPVEHTPDMQEQPSTTDVQPPPASNTPVLDLGGVKLWNAPRSAPGTPASAAALKALPDSYFEPTASEIKDAFMSQQRLHENLVNAPLRTQAMREKEDKEKSKRWPQTTIRIQFPNQMQLQRSFPSTDKIRSVYAFVRNSLTDEAKPIKFVLYQTPPRRELKVSDLTVKNLTLTQLHLAPSSMLHLTFEDPSLNGSNDLPPLLPSILELAQDLPPPPKFEPEPASASQNKPKARTLGGGGSSQASGGPLPKWLKLPGGRK